MDLSSVQDVLFLLDPEFSLLITLKSPHSIIKFFLSNAACWKKKHLCWLSNFFQDKSTDSESEDSEAKTLESQDENSTTQGN